MMFFKKKRGQVPLLGDWIIDIIMVVLITLAFLGIVKSYVVGTKFEKSFLAKDIAMLVDTVYTSPNNLLLSYSENSLFFSYKFEDGIVYVFEGEEDNIVSVESYPYTESKKIMLTTTILKPNLKIEKDKDYDVYRIMEGVEGAVVPLMFLKNNYKIVPFSGKLV